MHRVTKLKGSYDILKMIGSGSNDKNNSDNYGNDVYNSEYLVRVDNLGITHNGTLTEAHYQDRYSNDGINQLPVYSTPYYRGRLDIINDLLYTENGATSNYTGLLSIYNRIINTDSNIMLGIRYPSVREINNLLK